MEEVSGNFYGSDNPASHEKLWLTGPDHENATIRKLPDVQPAGRAALTAYARNITNGTAAVLQDAVLQTAFCTPRRIIAFTPNRFLTEAGNNEVFLLSKASASNKSKFVVKS
jgi:hypothetical protein